MEQNHLKRDSRRTKRPEGKFEVKGKESEENQRQNFLLPPTITNFFTDMRKQQLEATLHTQKSELDSKPQYITVGYHPFSLPADYSFNDTVTKDTLAECIQQMIYKAASSIQADCLMTGENVLQPEIDGLNKYLDFFKLAFKDYKEKKDQIDKQLQILEEKCEIRRNYLQNKLNAEKDLEYLIKNDPDYIALNRLFTTLNPIADQLNTSTENKDESFGNRLIDEKNPLSTYNRDFTVTKSLSIKFYDICKIIRSQMHSQSLDKKIIKLQLEEFKKEILNASQYREELIPLLSKNQITLDQLRDKINYYIDKYLV
jgi:hypothetical protein